MIRCRFCAIAQGKVKDYVIWCNDTFVAFLDINPVKLGHCLLIPKKHIDYLFDLDEDLYYELFKTARYLSEPLRKVTGAKKIGIAVVGFDVPHVHLHLVPLHRPHELFDFKKLSQIKPGELATIHHKLTRILTSTALEGGRW